MELKRDESDLLNNLERLKGGGLNLNKVENEKVCRVQHMLFNIGLVILVLVLSTLWRQVDGSINFHFFLNNLPYISET